MPIKITRKPPDLYDLEWRQMIFGATYEDRFGHVYLVLSGAHQSPGGRKALRIDARNPHLLDIVFFKDVASPDRFREVNLGVEISDLSAGS